MDEARQDAKSYLAKGEKCYRQGDYDEAITWFTKSIEEGPSDAAYDYRGCAYMAKEEWDKAISDLTEAIALCPPEDKDGLSKTYYNRAEAHRRKGDEGQALKDVEMAIELNFANREAQRLWGFLTKRGTPSPDLLRKYLGGSLPADRKISVWEKLCMIVFYAGVAYCIIMVIRQCAR